MFVLDRYPAAQITNNSQRHRSRLPKRFEFEQGRVSCTYIPKRRVTYLSSGKPSKKNSVLRALVSSKANTPLSSYESRFTWSEGVVMFISFVV